MKSLNIGASSLSSEVVRQCRFRGSLQGALGVLGNRAKEPFELLAVLGGQRIEGGVDVLGEEDTHLRLERPSFVEEVARETLGDRADQFTVALRARRAGPK